jgi:hypothetical protein
VNAKSQQSRLKWVRKFSFIPPGICLLPCGVRSASRASDKSCPGVATSAGPMPLLITEEERKKTGDDPTTGGLEAWEPRGVAEPACAALLASALEATACCEDREERRGVLF